LSASEFELPLTAYLGDKALPQLYLATPLTNLDLPRRRHIQSDVAHVKQAVERSTKLDRVDSESWPISVYAPIERTPPWLEDGLANREIYKLNLSRLHDSDGLIVIAENGGSAGVGQELEWATRLGIPIAFLTAADVSRQIAGVPAFISAQSYNRDPSTLMSQVENFLQQWKPLILDGPRRRASREFRYEPITLLLRGAWQSCPNPTGVAAQVRVDFDYLDLALSDARYVATMPIDTLIEVAHHLSVPLSNLGKTSSFILPVPMLRALTAVAAEEGWHDSVVDRLLYEGRAALDRGDQIDLRTVQAWRLLRQNLK